MGLDDLTGVLSRYFLVGYWVPSFFALAALAVWLPTSSLPNEYVPLSWSAKFLVVGFVAIPLGLMLLGLRYPLTRVFEGYRLERRRLRYVRAPLVWLQGRSFDRLMRSREDKTQASGRRTTAARLLDRRFHSDRSRLLPTRFGNAYRASENYSYTRYGLDTVAIWPRIDALLTERERELHTNAASDLAFFVNGTLWATIVGIVFVATTSLDAWWQYLLAFIVSYVLYRASVGAAERLGTERRASVDLHRSELYVRLGLREPASLEEAREHHARAVNQFLLFGIPIPAHLTSGEKDDVPNVPTCCSLLRRLLKRS